MAHRKKSEIEFIQDTFCPQVAVLCSYDAEVVCRKNALTFVELVQPFCRFNGEIKISDASNNLCTIGNLRVEIKDINAMPPQPHLAKKLLDESVSNGLQNSPQNFIEKQINANNYNFVANVNTPWFESWRECFIKIGYPNDHEFLKHFLSCIFVVSTSHLDPLDQFQKLVIEHQQAPVTNGLPKWFFPNHQNYKYFVLLHDVREGEISK